MVFVWLASTAGLAGACGDEGGVAGPGGGGAGGGSGSGGLGGSCAVASDEAVPSPVDIIVTIDQSASMGEEIDGVIANFRSSLVDILSAAKLDYRVVFVTSVSGLPTGPEIFQASVGVNSSDALTLLLWTYDGFTKAPNTCDKVADSSVEWASWLRFDARKVFIVVSDDDPSSFECAEVAPACTTDCAGCANDCAGYCPNHQCPSYADRPAAWGGGSFPEELYALQPTGMFGTAQDPKWVMHSIVPVTQELGPGEPLTSLQQVCDSNGNTGETSGVEYQKLSRLSGGLRFPSCDTDYSPVFQSIASTIVPLACTFRLESTNLGTPDLDKINVTIDTGSGPEVIPRDEARTCDGGADGWQLGASGSVIVLCGASCERLKQAANAQVGITVGCETVVQ